MSSSLTVIRPSRGWRAIGWRDVRDVWAYRELLVFLARRDVTVRYRETALGIVWAVLQPASSMIVFTLFFGQLARMPSDGVPYPIFAYAGLLPWQLFAGALNQSANSLLANQGVVTKVYCPRLIFPISSILVTLVDFGIASLLLGVLMIWFRVVPGLAILALPFLLLLAVVPALGIGLGVSALNARFRDVRMITPFLLQLGMLATPIVYPTSLVPARFQALLGLNPMAAVITGVRWALLGTEAPSAGMILVASAAGLFLLVGGVMIFRRNEWSFADAV